MDGEKVLRLNKHRKVIFYYHFDGNPYGKNNNSSVSHIIQRPEFNYFKNVFSLEMTCVRRYYRKFNLLMAGTSKKSQYMSNFMSQFYIFWITFTIDYVQGSLKIFFPCVCVLKNMLIFDDIPRGKLKIRPRAFKRTYLKQRFMHSVTIK